MRTGSMIVKIIIIGKTLVFCTLHFPRSSDSLHLERLPNLLPFMYLPQDRKPKTDDYHGLVPESGVTLNPLGGQLKLGLAKDYRNSHCDGKKPFALLLPTELVECILTETKQVCQDLCR